MSRSISSENVNKAKINSNKYNYNQSNKSLGRQIRFAPILEEQQLNNQNPINDLNNNSYAQNNNNSSFENSNIDYRTMNKFHPSLNLSSLPPIFEIPKTRTDSNILGNLKFGNNINLNNLKTKNYYYENNSNIKMMRGSKFNKQNIKTLANLKGFNNTVNCNENKNQIKQKIPNFLPPINNHTYYNDQIKEKNNMIINLENKLSKKLLKPIQIKSLQYKKNDGCSQKYYSNDNREHNNNVNESSMKYYYDLTNRNIIKSEKFKEEKLLKNKEISNISTCQNKNYINKNIVILNSKENKIQRKNSNIFFNPDKDEFIPITKNKNRVLHITTLEILDKFDISIKNFSLYENYINNWLKIKQNTLQIKYIIENDKFTCYNIIIERSKHCSLGNLLRSIGSINENLIKDICKQIIPLLTIFATNFDNNTINDINDQLYNHFDIDNIWINEKYNISIYPGKLSTVDKKTNKNINNFLIKKFGLNKDNNILILNEGNCSSNKNNNLQLNINLINFGITLLNINIFILNITVNDLFEITSNENINSSCCLYHFFYNNNKLFKNLYDTYIKNNIISEDYINFLHSLTIFEEKNIFDSISNHIFININNAVNNNINEGNYINELIKIGKIYDFSNEYYTSNSNIENIDLIKQKILNRINLLKNYYEVNEIKDTKSLYSINKVDLDELCKELRVNFEELHDKLLVIYESVLDGQKQI